MPRWQRITYKPPFHAELDIWPPRSCSRKKPLLDRIFIPRVFLDCLNDLPSRQEEGILHWLDLLSLRLADYTFSEADWYGVNVAWSSVRSR